MCLVRLGLVRFRELNGHLLGKSCSFGLPYIFFVVLLIVILPRLGKRELICLLSFTCNYMVFLRKGFLFLWVLGIGCDILVLWF